MLTTNVIGRSERIHDPEQTAKAVEVGHPGDQGEPEAPLRGLMPMPSSRDDLRDLARADLDVTVR